MKKAYFIQILFAVVFILFWLYAIYAKVGDFTGFKAEMANQVFPHSVAAVLPYILPVAWFSVAALLVFDKSRLAGMMVNIVLLLAFNIYVGLAVLEVYAFKPCSCAGLFHFDWNEQFYFNLIVTAVAAAGLIVTFKDRERRNKVWTG